MGRMVIDQFNEVKVPDVYLAQKNKHILGCLNAVSNLKLSFFLNDMNTCSFSVPRIHGGKKNNLYDELEPKMIILIVGYGWYEINVSLSSDGGYEVKEVSGKSLEYELTQFMVHDFYINSIDVDVLYDDYVPVVFYTPITTVGPPDLLHLIIDECPGWSIGHVDNELYDMQRTFEIDDQDVYSLLTGAVSEAFGCFFIFDTFERTINAYITENYGRNTNIFISFDNLNETVQIDVDDTAIKTVYRLISNDEYLIPNEVNPSGTDKICNYSYYLSTKYMRQSTIDSYNNYVAQYKIQEPIYQNLLLQRGTLLENKYQLEYKGAPTTDLENWYIYGVVALEEKLTTVQNSLNVLIALGKGMSSSAYYNSEYLPTWNKVQSIKSVLEILKAQVVDYDDQIATIDVQIDEIVSILNMQNYFTQEDWEDLNHHNYTANYTNENYVVTDEDNDAERQAIEMEFLKSAQKDLEVACRPQYSFSTTTSNLLSRREFEKLWDDFELGNFIRVEVNDTYSVKMRLISYSIDFDNLQSIDVSYSDVIDMGGALKDGQSILAQASSTSSSVTSSKTKWNEGATQGTWVSKVRSEGLNSAEVAIANADDETTVMDARGITGRKYNDQRQDYDPEQYRLTHNLFAFTDDNWQSVKSAFGKMLIDGNWVYGLIADVLIGRFMLSSNLTIQNDDSSVILDGTGASFVNCGIEIVNGDNIIKLNSENGLEFINSNGTIVDMDILTGDFTLTGGLLKSGNYVADTSGMMIDLTNSVIDSKNFKVDSDGKINAVDGRFTGKIFASSFIGGNIQSTNYYLRDENDELIRDEVTGDPKPTGIGTFIDLTSGVSTFSGEYTYAWLDESIPTPHQAYIKLENGRLRITDTTNDQNTIFYSHEGISTTDDANGASGVIDFRSRIYNAASEGSEYKGITIKTKNSPVALMSAGNSVIINPRSGSSTNLFEFDTSVVSDYGRLRFGTRTFVTEDEGVTYSKKLDCGLLFDHTASAQAIYATDGDGTKDGLIDFHAKNIYAESINGGNTSKPITDLSITSSTIVETNADGTNTYTITRDANGVITNVVDGDGNTITISIS